MQHPAYHNVPDGSSRGGRAEDKPQRDGSTTRFIVGGWSATQDRPDHQAHLDHDVQPLLCLITCGGSFNHATGHYRESLIVYGAAAALRNDQGAHTETVEDHNRRFSRRQPLTCRFPHVLTVLNSMEFLG
jgi:hypothetical protein